MRWLDDHHADEAAGAPSVPKSSNPSDSDHELSGGSYFHSISTAVEIAAGRYF